VAAAAWLKVARLERTRLGPRGPGGPCRASRRHPSRRGPGHRPRPPAGRAWPHRPRLPRRSAASERGRRSRRT
jgi:hypothetical protein